MKHFLLTRIALLAIFCLASICASAKYTLHAYDGNITVERGGQVIPTEYGMELRANDMVVIPEGCSIEIFNSFNSKIFKSAKCGRFGVSKIMIDAQMLANDSGANVNSRLRMGKNDSPTQEVYIDNGKVTRSLEVYDPSAENLQIDTDLLGRKFMAMLHNTTDSIDMPLPIDKINGQDGECGFRLINTLEFPVYFNVVKISNADNASVEISELGQPMGSYVVKPSQALSRLQFTPLAEGEKHVLILTHYYFDIDKLIESLHQLPTGTIGDTPSDEALPIYVKCL